MRTVLVVDDSEFMRRKLVRMVESQGHETVEANNGREGLRLIKEQKPDCVMLDLIMPELGGLGLLKSLREQELDTRVIVMTADIQEGTRQKCLALGADAVLYKPPQADEVRSALWHVFSPRSDSSHAAN